MNARLAACLLATWVVWGTTYLAIKIALASFPPFLQIGTRLVVAGMVLLFWAWRRGREMPTRKEWRNAWIIGAVMIAANQGGVAYAEQSVASGMVVAFIAIVPALITIASLPFGIRPRRAEVFGIVAGFAGVLLLVHGDAFAASPAGLIAMTIAALGWAIGSVLTQHTLPLAQGAAGFASQMICGGLLMLGLSALTGETLHSPLQALAVAAWMYLVVFGSLIAFVAYMVLLASTSRALATSYTFVNPVIAMLLGVSLAGEHVTTHEWIAVGIIVVAVTVVICSRRESMTSRPAECPPSPLLRS